MNKEYGIKVTNKPFQRKEGVMSLNLKTTFKSIALAGLVATAPMAANDTQAADKASFNTTSTQTTKPTPAQLTRTAMAYSAKNDAVGIFINIAPDTQFTPQRLGSLIVKKFKEDGIQAAYIYNYARAGDSSVSFFVRGVPYTGYGIDKIEEGYNLASATIRAIQADNRNKMAMNELAAN